MEGAGFSVKMPSRPSSSRVNFFTPLLSKVLVEVEAQREVVDDKLAVTAVC